jgi:NAD(P)-dependent dehydrogenase (short-subunit alcohol dehydrogenase family)
MPESQTLSGKVALVTGANRGIGLETCRQLAALGATVVLSARTLHKAEPAARSLPGTIVPLALDVADSSHIAAAAQFLQSRFGRLDILVNNAGILIEPGGWSQNNSPSVSPQILRRTFDVNFFGLIELTQALLPLLKKAPAARIVNLTSILGSLTLHADPASPIYNSKLLAYNSSKSALNAFTIHLSHALSHTPIKVNSAHPGWVKTEMGGEGAFLDLDQGAATTVRLATLPPDGPSGGCFHLHETLPW